MAQGRPEREFLWDSQSPRNFGHLISQNSFTMVVGGLLQAGLVMVISIVTVTHPNARRTVQATTSN